MGMTIRSIYSDGSMSPLCPLHPDGVVEDCETCLPQDDEDDYYDVEVSDDYYDEGTIGTPEMVSDPNREDGLTPAAVDDTDVDDVWLRKR